MFIVTPGKFDVIEGGNHAVFEYRKLRSYRVFGRACREIAIATSQTSGSEWAKRCEWLVINTGHKELLLLLQRCFNGYDVFSGEGGVKAVWETRRLGMIMHSRKTSFGELRRAAK
jgi:hypothetical protein